MKTLRNNEFEMAYVDQGRGAVLLLVHGFPLSHAMWRFQIDALSDEFRVIAPDLRGFGASRWSFDNPKAASLSMETHADDMAKLLEGLGIVEPVVFCGLSMGGYVAWQFVRRHAARLGGLILCDTRSVADTDEARRQRHSMADRVLELGSQIAADAMMPKLFHRGAIERNSDVAAAARRVICETAPETIAATQRGMAVRIDAALLLPEISVPTLVLCGEYDEISPPDEMRTIAAAIPDANFIVIEDAGHLAPLENPAAVNESIRTFLNETICR